MNEVYLKIGEVVSAYKIWKFWEKKATKVKKIPRKQRREATTTTAAPPPNEHDLRSLVDGLERYYNRLKLNFIEQHPDSIELMTSELKKVRMSFKSTLISKEI